MAIDTTEQILCHMLYPRPRGKWTDSKRGVRWQDVIAAANR